eukprot:TRINITY_DN862_c0_g1_i2.p1 TRINITY_DN862_c0_g1~~TRINITY_DN862_c0_g1_i2.p1  ORF type:complete len:529 (+),score=73.80 TRINITY_DN862_c0_g1_i2:255-1841(+)
MVNIYLIIVAVILVLAIVAGSIYILVYFQHPEDKNTAYFPKIIVILSLTLACISILMLPFDVANAQTNGGFPMDILWLVVYIVIAGMVVVVIPFAIFYYEGEEAEGENTQVSSAVKGTIATIIIFGLITVILYLFLGIAEIPVVKLTGNLYTAEPLFLNTTNTTAVTNSTVDNTTGTEELQLAEFYYDFSERFYFEEEDDNTTVITHNSTYYLYNDTVKAVTLSRSSQLLKYRVSIVLYIITMIVFGGWILFIIFGGIGLIAFPFDMIQGFMKRPIPINLQQYTEKKLKIGERANGLLDVAKTIKERMKKGKRSRKDRQNYNRFRQAVFLLEEDYEYIKECYQRQGSKILLAYFQLVLGVLGICLTLLWVLHIILYVFTYPYPFSPFLNSMVIAMDKVFGLFGTIGYGLFSFYLLLCVIKGNFKFGMRMFFLFPIHPMRVGGTMMNAFLFNTLLIMVCAVSITQFCTQAFADYTSSTAINSMFQMSVKNLMGIRYFFQAYVYCLFAMIFITAIFLAIKPADKPAQIVL